MLQAPGSPGSGPSMPSLRRIDLPFFLVEGWCGYFKRHIAHMPMYSISGWWFGTWILLFHSGGNNHPNWLSWFAYGLGIGKKKYGDLIYWKWFYRVLGINAWLLWLCWDSFWECTWDFIDESTCFHVFFVLRWFVVCGMSFCGAQTNAMFGWNIDWDRPSKHGELSFTGF